MGCCDGVTDFSYSLAVDITGVDGIKLVSNGREMRIGGVRRRIWIGILEVRIIPPGPGGRRIKCTIFERGSTMI